MPLTSAKSNQSDDWSPQKQVVPKKIAVDSWLGEPVSEVDGGARRSDLNVVAEGTSEQD